MGHQLRPIEEWTLPEQRHHSISVRYGLLNANHVESFYLPFRASRFPLSRMWVFVNNLADRRGRYRTRYTRDAIGRIETKTETIQDQTAVYRYTYDTAGRLEVVERDGVAIERYGYDANSNRVSALVENRPVISDTVVEIDTQDRLLRYGDKTFSYTPAGEMQSQTENGLTTAYTYDDFAYLYTALFDELTIFGFPDWLANMPLMLDALLMPLTANLFGDIYLSYLDLRSPEGALCK